MFSSRTYFPTLLSIMLCFSPVAYGQLTNVDVFIQAGAADAELLSQAYLAPFGKGFGANLNSGWANTAKTHDFLGFDITVMASAAFTPSSDKTFDLSTLDLQFMRLSNPSADPTTPTVIGSKNSGPLVDIFVENPFTGQDEILDSFELPPGIDFSYVPSPMVQASVGFLMNTDIIIRYFPDTEIDKDIGKAGLFGFGLKHDLLQYFPGGGLLPIDLSLLVGWTSFEATAGLDVFVDDPSNAPNADLDNQQVELDADSFTMNLLLSKKFSLLTLFGSVGFENSSVNLKLTGNYPITVVETNILDPNFGQQVTKIITDPVDISIDGANDLRASAGFQLSFVLFNVYGNYTFAQYPVANLGLAFGFR